MKNLFLTVLMATVVGTIVAQERPTHEIHAAMLYNFIKYVQWPNEGEAGEFVVGGREGTRRKELAHRRHGAVADTLLMRP